MKWKKILIFTVTSILLCQPVIVGEKYNYESTESKSYEYNDKKEKYTIHDN